MDFNVTRIGFTGAANTRNVPKKTEDAKTDKTVNASEAVPIGKTETNETKAPIETKPADAQASLNLGFIRSSKPISEINAPEIKNLYTMADIINFRQPTENEYTRIEASTNDAMQNVMKAGTRANAIASTTEIETLMNGLPPAKELRPVEEYFA